MRITKPFQVPSLQLQYELLQSKFLTDGVQRWGSMEKSHACKGHFFLALTISQDSFLGGSAVKKSTCNAGDAGSIPGLRRCPGGGNGNPLQYSCLENSMDRGAWWNTVHGAVKESDTTEKINRTSISQEHVTAAGCSASSTNARHTLAGKPRWFPGASCGTAWPRAQPKSLLVCCWTSRFYNCCPVAIVQEFQFSL